VTQTGCLEQRHVVVDGRSVLYGTVGAGPDLVIVHGLSGSWRWWSLLIDRLAEHHRLHLVRLPRLGRLRAGGLAPWLGRLLDAGGLERADVVGHSLGGLVAAELAAREPDLVRRLALVAPAGIPCGRGVLGRSFPLFEELYDVRTHLPTIVADAVRTGPVSIVHGVVYVWERDLRAELGAVQAPTLLVWGERDRLLPARIAEEWRRFLPHATLVRLPCGHVPMWEAPDSLARCMLDFLGDEVADDVGDEGGLGVGDGMRLVGNDNETSGRQ
jgi:pimeloyl-ACP methyl ester carboxylesterase